MRTLRLLISSLVVYILIACGSALTQTTAGDGEVDAASMLDALANPVPDAIAGPLPPITATESCNKQAPGPSGVTYVYAEHAFPGYTAMQLASVVTISTLTAAGQTIPGYGQSVGGALVRDGSAAQFCGVTTATTSTISVSSVTFILPQ
jgi:hypothetical protein